MKLKKLLAGVLSAVMVLGTMLMPAFADNTAPTFDIDELDNAGIVDIFTKFGTNNQYCGENGLYKKVYDKLVAGNNDISKYVYASEFFIKSANKGNCNKFDVELSSDKETSFLIIWRFANDVNSYKIKLDASNNYSARLGSGNSQYSSFLSSFSLNTLIIPVTEELCTIAYDVSESTDSYEKFKNAKLGETSVCAEDATITISACGYTDSNYTNKVTATNEPKTFNYVNSDVAKLSDGRTYASLKDAYAAAEDNDTITLLKDTTVKSAEFQLNKPVTFDLNEKRMTVDTENSQTMYVYKNITYKNGTIDISGANVGQAVWSFYADNVTLTMDNISLERNGIVSVGSAVFDRILTTTGGKVVFKDSKVDLTANNSDDYTGRFVNYADIELNNTNVTLNKFDGAFANSNITIKGNSEINVNNCQYAVNNSKFTMNDNSKFTAKGCIEPAIKLGEGSFIDLNGTSALIIKESNNGDVKFRNEVTDEQKAGITIDVEKNAILDADLSDIINDATVTGKANAVSVEFEATDDANVYNIVLTAPSATQIHEFTSAQLKFAKGNNAIGYEIAEANDKISVNEQGDNVYLFNLKSGANIVGEENKIVIGKVIFEGYSEDSVDFKIDTAYENKVVATKGQNITETFTVGNEKLTVNDKEKGIIDAEFKEPECEVTINVAMNEPVTDNKAAYQNMKVVISGQGIAEPIVKELGSDVNAQAADGVYTVNATLKQKNTYIITVSGEGYRTAKYQLKTKEKETATVNFWNNVQLSGSELVMETGDNTTKANANFIAGDIIKDNKLNIYDLSAVVAYFGDKATDRNNVWDKVKYDINRDGKIDAEDVSIVLDAWKALEALGQN